MSGRAVPAAVPGRHLLLVAADARLRDLLRAYLLRHGFRVTAPRAPDRAARLLEGLAFDLIVVDGAGAVLAALCAAGAAPVVALVEDDAADRAARTAGVARALRRPVAPERLLAALEALLAGAGGPLPSSGREGQGGGISGGGADEARGARGGATAAAPTPQAAPPQAAPPPTPPGTLRLGAVLFESGSGALRAAGGEVPLTASEMRLLRRLASCAGRPVSRQQLVEALGAEAEPPEPRAVDVQVARLRRKIEPDAAAPRYLLTVRGTGYMLRPD